MLLYSCVLLDFINRFAHKLVVIVSFVRK